MLAGLAPLLALWSYLVGLSPHDAHGLAAAYSVRHIGECVPAEAIDVPYLSAVVTVRRLRELERRYGLRTAEARAKAWRVGVGG